MQLPAQTQPDPQLPQPITVAPGEPANNPLTAEQQHEALTISFDFLKGFERDLRYDFSCADQPGLRAFILNVFPRWGVTGGVGCNVFVVHGVGVGPVESDFNREKPDGIIPPAPKFSPAGEKIFAEAILPVHLFVRRYTPNPRWCLAGEWQAFLDSCKDALQADKELCEADDALRASQAAARERLAEAQLHPETAMAKAVAQALKQAGLMKPKGGGQ
jgi:hypothetical protein